MGLRTGPTIQRARESFLPDMFHMPFLCDPNSVSYARRYVYTSLIEPYLQIRLLHLYYTVPRTSAHIECVLRAFSLDELPEYEALSYIREDPGKHGHEIYVDQSRFLVGPNLRIALKRMRDESRGDWIWIDAICTNMDDHAERSAHISKMRTIFSKASQVVV